MNNVHLVHQRHTPPTTKLTFDILLSTPTFHILDREPLVPGGLGQPVVQATQVCRKTSGAAVNIEC